MDIDLIRVIIDFGLVVLIWMVQLVIYPGFKYYNNETLLYWHAKYTIRIAILVIPLMFSQLIIYGLALFRALELFEIIGSLIVLFMWLITFSIFVPLHNKIASNGYSEKTLDKLVTYNWIRTLFWSILFVLSCWNFFSEH